MAFRTPEQDKSSPSLGYRLSSNRQPGIEQANNRMPSRPRFNPGDIPRRVLDQMPEYKRPIGIPGMGSYQNMGIGSLTPSNIGVDRHPTTMDPIMAFAMNPQVRRDFADKWELEKQMDPNNFLTNRIAVGEQFNVDPFGDIFQYNQQRLLPTGRTLFGDEQAAVDSSDWRTLEKILGAGGNPDDYVQMAGLDDDDDYGPFIPPSVLEWDRDFQYGPADEYEFDYIKGLDAFPDFKPEYSARGGIMSLKR